MELEAFVGAPVSKGVLFGSIVGSSLTRMAMQPVSLDIIRFSDPVKLVGGWLCYGSMGELVLGSILIMTLKTIEKWSGSRKFAGYILVTGSLSLIIHLLVYKVFGVASWAQVRPGPVSIVFSLLVKYFIDIPTTSALSEKLVTYMWAALYCITAGAVPQAVVGTISGLIAVSNLLPFRNVSVPKPISDFVWKIGGKFFGTTQKAKPTPGEIMAFHEQGYQDGPYQEQLLPGAHENWGDAGLRRRRAAPIDPELQQALQESLASTQPEPQPVTVSESSIAVLTDMGFERESSRQALLQSRGSVEMAIQRLTGGF